MLKQKDAELFRLCEDRLKVVADMVEVFGHDDVSTVVSTICFIKYFVENLMSSRKYFFVFELGNKN